MKPEVDKHIEKVYLNILRKMLKSPEKWIDDNDEYLSPFVNKDNELRFKTRDRLLTMSREESIYIRKRDFDSILSSTTTIHEIDISWYDFKTRRLLNRLFNYWGKKEEYERAEKTTELLRTSLGKEMDRFLKLTKIKDKI